MIVGLTVYRGSKLKLELEAHPTPELGYISNWIYKFALKWYLKLKSTFLKTKYLRTFQIYDKLFIEVWIF